MEFKGRIMKVLPVTSGTNQNNKEWKKQEFVFEYFEQQTDRYSDKVCLSIMNDRIAEYDLHENDDVLIGFGHSIREYQGRYFNELRSCWAYKGIGRELVLKLKYYNADYVKNDISKLLKNKCQEICTFTSNSFLVPVPLHYFGFLVRGYNQAEVIANAIKCASSRSSVVKLLRGRYKRSQTKLKSSDRTKNVSDAFLCTSLCDNIDKNSKIILIDDVSTTGATSRECCKVLRNAGFTNLNVLTLSCRC